MHAHMFSHTHTHTHTHAHTSHTHTHAYTHTHAHTPDTHTHTPDTHTSHTHTHKHKHTWLVSGAGELTLLREENVSRSVWNGDADCGTGFRLIRTESDSLRPNAGLRSGSSESRVKQSSNETVYIYNISVHSSTLCSCSEGQIHAGKWQVKSNSK